MITPYLVALALMAIGFVPMQALPTRRAAMIAGAIGIALIPLALLVLNIARPDLKSLWMVVAALWVCIVGYGIFCGGLTRFIILGRAPMSPQMRWGGVAGAYLVFVLMGWLALSQVMAAL